MSPRRTHRRSRGARAHARKPRLASQKVRYAVVGLGHIAQAAVLPAFAHAGENSELVALVSDDKVKLRALGKKYGVDNLFTYDNYDDLLKGGLVDAVYICLPNSMHRDFAVRAAQRRVHVLCEKPLAVTAEDCRAMIEAARANGVRLMTAYRLHFEDANMEAVDLVRQGKLGDVKLFSSVFCMQVRAGDIRLQRGLGGGTLYDIGIYCVNAARYLFQDEPEEVFAFSTGNTESRFREVDEMTTCVLRFPGGRLAQFVTSFGASDVSEFRIVGTKGDLRCEPAYEYIGDLKHELTLGGEKKQRSFPSRDQFAPELVYFSQCVLDREDPEPSGVEGLADVRVIEALYRSAESGAPVKLPPFEKRRRPGPHLEMRRPPVKEPKLVRTEPPSL